MMNNKEIKNMTRGAVVAALYIILISLYRLTSDSDFTFLLFPLPLLIYNRIANFKWCVLVELVVLVVSFFIVGDIYSYVGLVVSNVIGCLLFVLLISKCNNKILNFICIFLIYTFIEIFSVFYINYFEFKINVDTYIEQTINEFSSLFNFFDYETIKRTIYIALPVTFIIYALMKIIINYLLYYLIGIRLSIINKEEFKFKLIYSFKFVLFYFLFLVLFFITSYRYVFDYNIVVTIVYGILFFVVFTMSIYLIIQGGIYIKYLLPNINEVMAIIIMLLCIILFPIGIVFGLISNIKFSR